MKKTVVSLFCDQCPPGRELPAVTTATFNVDGTWREIELCERHCTEWEAAYRRIVSRSRPRGTKPRLLTPPPAPADGLREAPTRSPITIVPEPRQVDPVTVLGQDWVLSDHALDRVRHDRRASDLGAVLAACVNPATTYQQFLHGHQRMIYERDDVRVVVVPEEKVVISVLPSRQSQAV